MPNFEPPHATRMWLTQRRHLAETWFTRFEDQSLPGPMKFRRWNNSYSNNYKVVYQTPIYQGDQTDFRAIPDTVFPTRLKVKREIAYEFDNLPFEFKDPWAVSQDTTGDSSQTIHDFYREQVTPYEPWNDLGSLGVFLNVDRFGTLHYGTKYWRYYDYDSGSDSYDMKDDANLEEGDLINMDEILYGKGTEVSPTGSIEQTRVTPGDEPYREYRLEYKDPDNTMDFTAVYKAHMLTDHTSQPTKYSNQRKIDIDPRGMYHLVYESAGEVWYVNSEDGRRWSREELVSDYSHSAVNPSLAVYDSCVYVTYVENGDVMMKCRHKGNWQEPAPVGLKKAGYNNGTETTPVVAVGGTCYPNDGHIVVVVWDDHQFLRSNMLYLKYEFPYVDTSGQSVHRADTVTVNATNYPVYPSITCDDQMTEYTVCWREGSDIKCSEIHVGGGTCDQDKFYSYTTVSSIADASLASDTCVFAPSVTRDHNNNPVVAYEVRQAGWIYSDRWVNVRTYDGNSRSWNTTAYQMPYYSATGYGEAIAPSVGAHETTTSCGGNPEPGLRVAFHKNWGGGIRIGVIDCQYSEYAQISDGESYPSVVPFASNGSLRETYSAPHQVGPFTNAIRSTNSYLTKQATQNIRMVRDLRLQIGNDLALLGVTDLARRHGNNVLDEISWHAMPDSLVIGYDGEAHEILYTEPFSVTNGDHIDYRGILYCTDAPSMPAGVSIAVQLRKASDGSIVRSFSIPLRNLPSDTAIWTSWSRPLTQAPAFPVYLSLGIEGILPSGAVIGNAKVWLEDQYIPKMNVNESATLTLPNDFVLEPNHPNPFNPSTTISFALGLDGHVRLSVFNAVGKEVARLVNEERIAGRYQETFHAEDLPSGNYIARLVFGGKMQSQNMMLVK